MDNCVCEFFIKRLEDMLNSLIGATAIMRMNSNTPSTDSGYVQNNLNNQMINSSENLQSTYNRDNINLFSTSFYLFLFIVALMIILSRLKRNKDNTNNSKFKSSGSTYGIN